jgi:hypothetical protein
MERRIGVGSGAPSHLHAVVFNARTGQKVMLRDWSVPSFFATIHPASDETFIMCAGDAIRLLSADFNVIREQELSGLGYCSDEEISPSKRSFSVATITSESYQKTLIDSESLSVLAYFTTDPRQVHFTDSLLVGTCSPKQLCLRKLNESWQPFEFNGMDQKMREYSYKPAYFLNDSTLIIQAGSEMAVVTVEGKLLFQMNLPHKWVFGAPVTSSGGKRFALLEEKLRGATIEELDMYAFFSADHVVVYSLPDQKAVYTRKVQGTSPWAPGVEHRNQLALSSDGSLLAVFDHGMLQVYQLPVGKCRGRDDHR